jgi:COP9 signalosome complex subunit 5
MGVMYGKVRDHTFWITDAAALPVQGTETRVNAGNEVSNLCADVKLDLNFQAFEYMVSFQESGQASGKMEMLRGWYHS